MAKQKKDKKYVFEFGKLKLTKTGLTIISVMIVSCLVVLWFFFNFYYDETGVKIKPNENIKVNIQRNNE